MKKIRKTKKFFISPNQEDLKIGNFLPFTEIKNFCPYTWKTRNFLCLKNREFLRKSGSFESKLEKSSK